MSRLTVGSLFSGIGGLDLGFEHAGFDVRWQVEIDSWCRQVLTKHWPSVPKYEDVRDVGKHNLEWVDVIVGGFPCQDISIAGEGVGISGDRSGLWKEYARLIGELRPRYTVMENVTALLFRGLDTVLSDLASLGYDAEWGCLSASSFGLPQRRDRIFIVAYPQSVGCSGPVFQARKFHKGTQKPSVWGESKRATLLRGSNGRVRLLPQSWPDGMADGLPTGMDRHRGLGNAVVPQVAQYVAECVLSHFNATREAA